MTIEQRIDRALAYFTDEEHTGSFEVKQGKGKVLLSAPHATLQTREGAIKCAERYTGMLCLLLHEDLQCPVIYKTRHFLDDANHDPVSDYRDAVCRYIEQHHIQYFFDLHQLSPQRPMQLCISTGKGKNLMGQEALVPIIETLFQNHGIAPITVDDPFDGGSPHTVSSTVASHCQIPATQLEISTRLLMSGYPETNFPNVMETLSQLIAQLNRAPAKLPK